MIPETSDRRINFPFFEDFTKLDTVQFTTTDDSGTGTNLLLDARAGVMSVVTAAADNDYHLMSTAKKLFECATGKYPIYFEARVQLTEANTDDANVIVGLTDTLTAGNLQVNGAGPAASHKGFVWYKVDGGVVWKFEASNGTTKATNASAGAVTSGAWVRLGFQVEAHPDGVNAKVTPFFDGAALAPLLVPISGLSTLYGVFGVMAGGGAAETLNIDYLGVNQPR